MKGQVLPPPPSARRFLSRLRVPGVGYEDGRVERVLAFSRLFLALTSLIAWEIHPVASGPYYHFGRLVLLCYIAHSLVLLALLRIQRMPNRRFVFWAQVSDIGWAALLCLFTDAPNSIFFIFFLFAMLAAAFRWGFVETLTTAFIGAGLVLFQVAVVKYGPVSLQHMLSTNVDPPRIVLRCGFLLLTGFLLGFLAEGEKELRAEIDLTNRLLSQARVGNRFAGALYDALIELGRVFDSGEVYEVVSQSSTGRVFKWVTTSPERLAEVREIAPAQHASELMRGYPHTFYMQSNGEARRDSFAALDDEGRRLELSQLRHLQMPVPGVHSVLVVSHEMGRDWTARFVVVNGYVGRRRERELRFAQNVMRQVGPALYSVYLFRRFRSRAGAVERARVARELHDTVIQSLISIEMQIDVLRRRGTNNSQLPSELQRIQDLLRQEVLNLRELMQTMRPPDIGPHQFLDFIAQLVERFSRDTGVEARFVSELHEVTLPATTCRELARVVQEALVNIRKHSGAQSAVVRFGSQNGSWRLVIDDDGKGFPFAGRFTLTELDDFRWGPTVIKERVRTVGGDMVIESNPGHGSKLEITVPQKGNESHG
jgi:signal transduction histidine kinase